MFRAPISHALRTSRRAVVASTESASRAIVGTWILDQRASDSRDVGVNSGLLLAAALTAAGVAVNASSPRAEAAINKGGLPAAETPGNASPPSGLPRGATTPAEAGREHNAAVDGKRCGSEYNHNVPPSEGGDGRASEEGGGDDGATSPGDDDKEDGKLGIDLSATFVRLELKDFRGRQALMRVMCPPIDFRQEKDSGPEATMSASFVVPRGTNMLKVISTMVPPDEFMEMKQPVADKAGTSIAFCHKDGHGSVLFRQDSIPNHMGPKDSIHLYRDGGFTRRDLGVLVKGYQEAWSSFIRPDGSYRYIIAPGEPPAGVPGPPQPAPATSPRPAVPSSKVAGEEKLKQLGVEIYDKSTGDAPNWDSLAGYADVKQEIEDTLVMPLKYPEVFDLIARKTRSRFESNRPRAVLFEGPPGTGKTLSARIIAGRSDRPMIHVPVEGIMSKWYGDSEKKLSAIFDACEEIGGAIIFIDEIDAMAGSRGKVHMHEATRRILSVILQKVEGFEENTKNTLICATNRKEDLDSALLSRFQLTIPFGLPDTSTRRDIFGLYAKQLTQDELETLASISGGMSCRDIKETCQHAERRWASKMIRTQEEGEVPSLQEYVTCLDRRSREGAWSSRPAQT